MDAPRPFALDDLIGGAASGRLEVEGVNIDSRAIRPGEAFFAVAGLNSHGDVFALDAKARGARVMITDRAPATDPGLPVIIVDDARAVYARAAARQFAPAPKTMVGVTGTNGKSSVAAFTRQIWTACGVAAASIGTVGIETSGGVLASELTTPDPLTLHRSLGVLKGYGIDHVALEASSQGLDQRRVDGIRFAAVAFTNLSHDHLDYHTDMASYRDAKLRLFTNLVAEGGSAIVNVDDPEYEPFMFAALGGGATLLTIGAEGAWFEIKSVKPDGYGQDVKGRMVGEPADFHLPLTGAFQVNNAVIALGLAIAGGAPKEAAFAALSGLKGARGRLERVAEHNGAAIFIDYAHKPAALEATLAALRPYAVNKLGVVFGCGGDRDKAKRGMMGEIATRLADRVYVTDDNPRTEDAAAIRAEILATAKNALDIADRRAAIKRAIKELTRGDVLVVAGKGHEDYQIVGATKHPFSDHRVVAEVLKEL